MSFLLRFIPEPWGTIGLVLLVLAAYAYGNITGTGTERLRQETAKLTATIATMQRQADAALDIQTRMAQRLAELRASEQAHDATVDTLIKEIESRPAIGACVLDDARRLRLQSIRIGHPPANQRRRQ
ncbi:hypothetical protein [EBPR siphovirus 2]|nr:hypothetical protein [EBPR siphovirus 2]